MSQVVTSDEAKKKRCPFKDVLQANPMAGLGVGFGGCASDRCEGDGCMAWMQFGDRGACSMLAAKC